MKSGFRLILILVLLCPGFLSAGEKPREKTEGAGDTLGWYIVRPGDTLEGITVHFLGEKSLWPENWKLNPQVRDPHRLKIGQHLRIILHRQLPPRTAQIMEIGGRVDQQPSPNPWITAATGNLLKQEDGVRTHENSSTRLEFDDRTNLTINETSLVFLREVSRSLGGVDREQVEVVRGQADLSLHPERADSSDVEVILGGVSAKPKPGASGRALSRLRRSESDDAQIMVYGGKTQVAAAGRAVEVPAGSGTRVKKGAPPSPPEKLLPRPELRWPAGGEDLPYSNPTFSWNELVGAASYTLEICRDASCAELLLRQTEIPEGKWQPNDLPGGKLFWRVTAVAPSGLDGYPSKTRSLSISGGPDHQPPVVSLIPGTRIRPDGGVLHALPGARFELVARDEASGVAKLEYRWDGGKWKKLAKGHALRVPEAGTDHRFEARAEDHSGKYSKLLDLPVRMDVQELEVPKVLRAVEAEAPAP